MDRARLPIAVSAVFSKLRLTSKPAVARRALRRKHGRRQAERGRSFQTSQHLRSFDLMAACPLQVLDQLRNTLILFINFVTFKADTQPSVKRSDVGMSYWTTCLSCVAKR